MEDDMIRIETLEKSFQETLKSKDVWTVNREAKELVKFYRSRNEKKVEEILGSLEIFYDELCEEISPILAVSFLEMLKNLYKELGLNERKKKIIRKIQKFSPKILGNMGEFEYGINVSREEVENFINSFVSDNSEHFLNNILDAFLMALIGIKERAYDFYRGNIFLLLLDTEVIGWDGQKTSTIESDDATARMINYMGLELAWTAPNLRGVIKRFQEKFSEKEIIGFLKKSPIFNDDSLQIIEIGLKAYLEEKYLVSNHLLIPQIERAFRKLLELSGGLLYKENRNGGYHLFQLDKILRDEVLEKILGKDLCIYFRVVLTDIRGWNLRNEICHGMMPMNGFSFVISDRIFHVLLCLGNIRIIKKSPLV